MNPDPFIPGYFIYLLFIFLPGIGVGELLGIWKVGDTLAERFALAFGLGLSVATLVFLVKTSGVLGLRGVGLSTVYFTIGIGLAALVASFIIRKKIVFPIKPKTVDYALLGILLIQGVFLLLYFQKFPLFPQFQSEDFTNHINYVLGLISGSTVTVPTGLIYFGVHYQLAAGVLLVGGEPLFDIQGVMAILSVLSPLMFYLGAKKIFSSTRAGVIAALLYSLSGIIWYSGPLASGLYPNFFGILSTLFLVVGLTYVVAQPRSIPTWVFFAVVVLNAYMSHYTFLTILPAIVLLPAIRFVQKKPDRKNYVVPVLVVVVPALIPVLFFPKLVSYILYLASSGGGLVIGSTTLSSSLSSFPVLQYLAQQIYNDTATVALFVLAAIYVYFALRSRRAMVFVPFVWFFALVVAAPFNVSAWRYSYEAVVPLLLMASFALHSILPYSEKSAGGLNRKIKSSKEGSPLLRIIVAVIFLGMIIVGSAATQLVATSVVGASQVSNEQQSDYKAMIWMKQNTPTTASFLSVSDWWFSFSDVVAGKSTYYSYTATPNESISLAKDVKANYIIVTQLVTQSLPNIPDLFPWNNFPTSSNNNLALVYTNPDVRIYEINSTAS